MARKAFGKIRRSKVVGSRIKKSKVVGGRIKKSKTFKNKLKGSNAKNTRIKKYKAPKVIKSTRKGHSNIIGQLPSGKKQKGSTLGLHGRL